MEKEPQVQIEKKEAIEELEFMKSDISYRVKSITDNLNVIKQLVQMLGDKYYIGNDSEVSVVWGTLSDQDKLLENTRNHLRDIINAVEQDRARLGKVKKSE